MADDEDIPRQEPVAVEEDIGGPGLPMNKYHLRAPLFLGEEDVEQFITEFSDVAAICQWFAWVTLIQLRLCLTGPTKTLGVNQSRTTPYHPQGNGVVERNNQMLGNSLRSLLIGKSQEEWDLVLPQIMRAYRSTPPLQDTGDP